ncbi:hypothetical protein M3215_11435 [Bacillus cytotoxicus]|uniref:Uncharacterized protein n=1 Tax=Bacillus cytotoxicus TaxID=580165 RepID=A0ACC6A7W6_9BACI|nr:hypothetical protein [Bacillus cytotoxicus]
MKTKMIYQHYEYWDNHQKKRLVDIDESINKFIEENSIEVIDIRLTSTSFEEQMDVVALVMYKDSIEIESLQEVVNETLLILQECPEDADQNDLNGTINEAIEFLKKFSNQ